MRFSYWSREIAGWVLILGGLYCFVVAYDLLLSKRIFEAAPMVFIGFIVFRGGIHVLKVAVAAQAARNLSETSQTVARPISRVPVRPVGPTPPSEVLPGRSSVRAGTGRG